MGSVISPGVDHPDTGTLGPKVKKRDLWPELFELQGHSELYAGLMDAKLTPHSATVELQPAVTGSPGT